MNRNLKDILSHLKADPEQEALLRYLQNQLSDQEAHELEAKINDDAFLSDAMDGLAEIRSKAAIDNLVQNLNADLKKQIASKKKKRRLQGIPRQTWSIYAIIIILLLSLLAFIVIKKLL